MTDRGADELSRNERHRLRGIERAIALNDPDFAAEFDDLERARSHARRTRRRKSFGWIAGTVLGVATIVAGLILAWPLLGAAGFVILVAVTSRFVAEKPMIDRLRSLVRVVQTRPDPPS